MPITVFYTTAKQDVLHLLPEDSMKSKIVQRDGIHFSDLRSSVLRS